ncbi:MAG: GNAT family N-acetyltransferase [Rhodanobacteraceae bacterium]|nr:GNAT family N-acetyltransferase [Rhodanobacteraceae bacterium]
MPTYEICCDSSRFDIPAIHAFLTTSYWSPGIPLSVVERAIRHSLCFGAFAGDLQIGFARVVTDRATFGYLADVYVLPEHRGRGVSRRIMDAVAAHPELQGLRRFMLATRDAHALYAKYGFQPLSAPDRLMEVLKPNVYAQGTAG